MPKQPAFHGLRSSRPKFMTRTLRVAGAGLGHCGWAHSLARGTDFLMGAKAFAFVGAP